MSPEQELTHLTTRLTVKKSDGIHTGTGFYLAYDLGEGRMRLFCVTNRHVLKNAEVCSLSVTIGDAAGTPQYGKTVNVDFSDIGTGTIFHPDPDKDLAAFPVTDTISSMNAKGFPPFLKAISRSDLPKPDAFSGLGVAEDILMIGYPNGLFDQKNNMPILRRGITATSPALEFNGRQEFVIDCACFPGSSGSPIFLHQPLGFRQPDGSFLFGGGRSILLGILYAGPQISQAGEIVPRAIPTSSTLAVQSLAMMHLGYCVRSTELSFLDPYGFAETK